MKEFQTKIFKSGNSMAVRIPKGISLEKYQEATICQYKNKIVIKPKKTKWDLLFNELSEISSDTLTIDKLPPQKRKKYFD